MAEMLEVPEEPWVDARPKDAAAQPMDVDQPKDSEQGAEQGAEQDAEQDAEQPMDAEAMPRKAWVHIHIHSLVRSPRFWGRRSFGLKGCTSLNRDLFNFCCVRH